MTKREKIILIIMFLTIIWGWYILFYDPGQSSPPKASAVDTAGQDKKMLADLTQKLAQQTPTASEKHVLALAKDPWTKDPFLSSVSGLRPEKETSERKSNDKPSPVLANWVYSGYLEVAGKRLAIINGLEYEEGESLFPAGYYLEQVEKSHITIGVVGKQITFTLPLTEP